MMNGKPTIPSYGSDLVPYNTCMYTHRSLRLLPFRSLHLLPFRSPRRFPFPSCSALPVAFLFLLARLVAFLLALVLVHPVVIKKLCKVHGVHDVYWALGFVAVYLYLEA